MVFDSNRAKMSSKEKSRCAEDGVLPTIYPPVRRKSSRKTEFFLSFSYIVAPGAYACEDVICDPDANPESSFEASMTQLPHGTDHCPDGENEMDGE